VAKFHEVLSGPYPWGDYGRILVHGLVDFDEEQSRSCPCVMRADSWTSEIALPLGLMYVTERIKTAIINADFNSIEFQPVRVTKAVKIGWREWDMSTDAPKVYPAGSEPENYILRRKHNEVVCSEIPPLWNVNGSKIVGPFNDWASQWNDGDSSTPDLASLLGGLAFYVSPRLKSLLLSVAGGSVEFVD
jgi:hypothetical protein